MSKPKRNIIKAPQARKRKSLADPKTGRSKYQFFETELLGKFAYEPKDVHRLRTRASRIEARYGLEFKCADGVCRRIA